MVNPDTNEFYPALNKAGNPLKGTGPKRIVQQIIRIKRKDGNEYLYSTGEVNGYDAFGNPANAPSINQRFGKGPYSPMKGCMTSGPTQPKYELQGR